jgi:hypothetical protein
MTPQNDYWRATPTANGLGRKSRRETVPGGL